MSGKRYLDFSKKSVSHKPKIANASQKLKGIPTGPVRRGSNSWTIYRQENKGKEMPELREGYYASKPKPVKTKPNKTKQNKPKPNKARPSIAKAKR